MNITRLRITNYRGIAALDEQLDGGSAIAKGRNGAGKTTVLRAVRAALAGNDISADAIRKGATSAEILVDLDDITVRRAITEKGTSLTVKRGDMQAAKPQNYLNELLGTSPLDPIDLLTLKPKERRARILEALPCELTEEQLRAWVPELPEGFVVAGHGLEVLERLHKIFYDRRTVANAAAKEAKRVAAEASAKLGDVTEAPSGADVSEAARAVDVAKREEQLLALRRDEAEAQEQRSASTRARIRELRESARQLEATPAVDDDALATAIADHDAAREALAAAQTAHEAATALLDDLRAIDAARFDAVELATSTLAQAAELEAMVAATISAPTDEEVLAAKARSESALRALTTAEEQNVLAQAFAEASGLRDKADLAKKSADRLDAIVSTLRDEAPRQLLAASEAIRGLTLDGDDVMLDGVRLDALCGAEQMKLVIEIARRANAKGRGRMLICDGLERLDEEQLEIFVREATRDGWQLLGTRVSRGDVVVEHLSATEEAEAAE